jgi:hypothetical protein
LRRNGTELRLKHKPSKRDLEFSRSNLLALERDHVMNTGTLRTPVEEVFEGHGCLRVDNTHLSPGEVAAQIVARLDLPQLPPAPDPSLPPRHTGQSDQEVTGRQ